ncbi:MAG: OmpA family protein [Polyangiaceae bacterium]
MSCDGSEIALAREVAFQPLLHVPKPAEREVLKAVAALMRERPDILLIRIEVATRDDPRGDPERIRAAVESTQRRADAVLRYLWRSEKVSAERMEALGLGHGDRANPGQRFTTRLRIVTRR